MDSEIHRILTRTLNPVISRLGRVSHGRRKARFRAKSHGGSIRYSKETERDVELTRWLEKARTEIREEYAQGGLEEVLNLLKKAYGETFRYALLTGNEKASQILRESAEEIEEKYNTDIPKHLGEIGETEEIEISTDLNVSASEVSLTVRKADDLYLVVSFQGEKSIPLPKGEYEIIAEYEGVRDRTTVNVGEDAAAELELCQKLKRKQEREPEQQEDERDVEKDEKKEKKGYTHPVMREKSATKGSDKSSRKRTSQTNSHIKNTDVYRTKGIKSRLRRLKSGFRRRKRKTKGRIKRTGRRTYEVVKLSALLILISGVILGYASPSARAHMINGNPYGIVGDANDVIKDVSSLVSEVNTTEYFSSDEFDREKVEQQIHSRINEIRTSRGLSPLDYDEELEKIAREHSEDMASRNHLSHLSFNGDELQDRYRDAGYNCGIRAGGMIYQGAENIAKSYYETAIEGGEYYSDEEELAEGFVEQWMNSPGHRENILKRYWRREGIGIVMGEDDAVFATQNFC